MGMLENEWTQDRGLAGLVGVAGGDCLLVILLMGACLMKVEVRYTCCLLVGKW